MRFAHRLLPILAIAAVAIPVSGCGSDGSGSGYGGPRDSTEGEPQAQATTPAAPPGASARTCEGTAAGTEELRVTGVGCDAARSVASAWVNEPACSEPAGGSRFSCAVPGGYRCIGTNAERGVTVSCARSGASVAFISKPG